MTNAPAPVTSEATVFWEACRAMPVRTEPVRRRIQQSATPSARNGISTPPTPWRPAHTNDEITAAGQNPSRTVSPESRNPRIETSSIHGAIRMAAHATSRTTPWLRCWSGTSVVPCRPMWRLSTSSSGRAMKSTRSWTPIETGTPADRPRPTMASVRTPASSAIWAESLIATAARNATMTTMGIAAQRTMLPLTSAAAKPPSSNAR